MADIVSKEKRREMMANIRSKNTKPEILVRKLLHARGFRYRLHSEGIPGKPDLVFPSRKAVVFVHGCFWHCHGCRLFKWPSSRVEFWHDKLTGNKNRDERTRQKLNDEGWKVLTIWECAIRDQPPENIKQVMDWAGGWLDGPDTNLEIDGE